MNISAIYDHKNIENKIYNFWIKKKYFRSIPDKKKKPYTMVIPPPNITGNLHIGHILNNTIQDVLIRHARMKGYNACWVPGIDHASIATEIKILNELKKKGLSKSKLDRNEFIKFAWNWTNRYKIIIIKQLKKIGCSCDWDRIKFTMDKDLYKSVINLFVYLYNKGLIYREYKMINWDPKAKTTISDEEIIYKKKIEKLYYIKYKIKDEDYFITICTTRPETILADTAVCVHPNDKRYNHLRGKKAIIPIIERIVPIIEDEYVDKNFGTGCLKLTPAHDIKDNEISKRHNINVIDIFNDDATINDKGFHYKGKDRFKARKEIVQELIKSGLLIKEKKYLHKIAISERTKSIIEPKLSMQWFLKVQNFVIPALNAVSKDKIKFFPKKFKKNYKNWMKNIRDWNISRQLWWGHRIPAYFYGRNKNDFVVAENINKALELAKKKTLNYNLNVKNLIQDPDVLDTWFSSCIWPISVFNGIINPKNEEIEYYYPTKNLVTAPDILFFWVSRMIMIGYALRNKKPFNKVYFTGIVRDKYNKKMSKSIGNSPDPIKLINKYGSDSIRVGILLNSSPGRDLFFNEKICIQGRNFSKKIWNAFRLIKKWKYDKNKKVNKIGKIAIEWFSNNFNKKLEKIDILFKKNKISEILMILYKLFWDDFCCWYLEIVKPIYNNFLPRNIFFKSIEFFKKLLKILHPYMPFITEEIWKNLESNCNPIIISSWPKKKNYNIKIINSFKKAKKIIHNIRILRINQNILNKKTLPLLIDGKKEKTDCIILKMANLSKIDYINIKPKGKYYSFFLGSKKYFVPIENFFEPLKEKKKIEKNIEYYRNFLLKVKNKLNNKKFIFLAPKHIVYKEKKKMYDLIKKIKLLSNQIKKFL
jgi:valyl-tRNA synthetase